MKEYKRNKGDFCHSSENYFFYKINSIYHGINFSISYDSYFGVNKISYKGYIDMDKEYSHWLYHGQVFKYFL